LKDLDFTMCIEPRARDASSNRAKQLRPSSARAPPPSPRATRHRVCPFACARLPAAPPSRAKRPARPAAPRPAVERALGPLRPRGRSTRSAPPRATGVLSARAGTTPRPAAHDSRAERPRRPPRARRLPTYSYRQTGKKKNSRDLCICNCNAGTAPRSIAYQVPSPEGSGTQHSPETRYIKEFQRSKRG